MPSESKPRPATYADLQAVPDTKVAEIIDGELFVSPRPAPAHAHASSALGIDIGGSFHGKRSGGSGPGGWWIVDEPELHLGPNVVVPDLAGWRQDRMPFFPKTAWFDLVPDWACEVLSPSTERLDRVRKLNVYARAGLAHLWLVDPLAQTLEVYRLEAGRFVVLATHGGDEMVHAEPFEAFELDLTRLWPPLQP